MIPTPLRDVLIDTVGTVPYAPELPAGRAINAGPHGKERFKLLPRACMRYAFAEDGVKLNVGDVEVEATGAPVITEESDTLMLSYPTPTKGLVVTWLK